MGMISRLLPKKVRGCTAGFHEKGGRRLSVPAEGWRKLIPRHQMLSLRVNQLIRSFGQESCCWGRRELDHCPPRCQLEEFWVLPKVLGVCS